MSDNSYKINQLLGAGRTGSVYEAEDIKFQRQVALRRFSSSEDASVFTGQEKKFDKEAQSLSNLQHPNLLNVLDAGVDEDGPYVVSQLVEGRSLHEEIQKGALKVEEVVELAKQMLDALSMAHDLGYYHGAFTPDSVIMTPRARGGFRYVIIDIGLTKLVSYTHGEDKVLKLLADPAILAPELFDGSAADARSDLYMLGQVLYLCFAGVHPYGGLGLKEAKKKHLKGAPSIKKYNKYLHIDLVNWLGKLIDINPKNRPSSAVEAIELLSEVPMSAFKAPAKLTETGVTPVFKSKSALSAIVQSGPVKSMTTTFAKSDSGKPLIDLPTKRKLEDTTTEMSISTTSDELDLDDKSGSQAINFRNKRVAVLSSLEEKRKLRKEFILCLLALIVVGVVIIIIISAGESPSSYEASMMHNSPYTEAGDASS